MDVCQQKGWSRYLVVGYNIMGLFCLVRLILGNRRMFRGSIESVSLETWEGRSRVRVLCSGAKVWALDNLKILCRQWRGMELGISISIFLLEGRPCSAPASDNLPSFPLRQRGREGSIIILHPILPSPPFAILAIKKYMRYS